ncbi:MAG TPA: hypothetical protein VKM93_13700 [Terriglobia bacterium]|nr:hypothetical protein [Terriglobia bacterium]
MNGYFNYEIGWPELVERAAKVRDALPLEERAMSAKRVPSTSMARLMACPRP